MNDQPQNPLMTLLLIGGLAFLLMSGPCQKPPAPSPPAIQKVTAITLVYEKDLHVPAPALLAALSAVNLAPESVVGSAFEVDTTTGGGTVPKQYVIAVDAAKNYGLPCLVAQAGATVTKVVKNPATAAHVEECLK